MRTVPVKLAGKDRTLCFSVQVVMNMTDRYGGIEGFFDVLKGDDLGEKLSASVWALSQMTQAGAAYEKAMDMEVHEPLTEEHLLTLCDLPDLLSMSGAITEAMRVGTDREVEAEPPKNGKAPRAAKKAAN